MRFNTDPAQRDTKMELLWNRLIEHAEQLADIDKIKAARAVFSKARKDKKWVTWEVFEAAGAYPLSPSPCFCFPFIIVVLRRRRRPIFACANAARALCFPYAPRLHHPRMSQTRERMSDRWAYRRASLLSTIVTLRDRCIRLEYD